MAIPEFLLERGFESVEPIGPGAMGAVYRCRRKTSTTVIKCVGADKGGDTFGPRFKREIRILRELMHPNIVPIVAFNDSVPPYWLEMEYAPRGDLKKNIPGMLGDIDAIRDIFLQICNGVRYLHERPNPIIHRDLKPRNILIFEGRRAKISDVGLAREVDRDTISLTYTGEWGGTFTICPQSK